MTSGPSSTYPQRAYRNPTDVLVKFLDSKHGKNWSIWEFRAEGTGYPDSEVYGRIRHYPWPDHHPPPFALVPNIMASMRNWLKDSETQKDERVVVVHCKAGKGRSGTVACSYLISEEGWNKEDALTRFTTRRMRAGFGAGISIPSQLRWVGYVDQWTKISKIYVERQIEILEVHVWGLRDGVKVAIEGFVDEGKTIKTFHQFKKHERLVVDATAQNNSTFADLAGLKSEGTVGKPRSKTVHGSNLIDESQADKQALELSGADHDVGGSAVIFRPSTRVVLPTSDICIDFERRNRARYGYSMVTAVAHVWFNAYFESLRTGVETTLRRPPSSGIFEIEWDAMDGIKGSSRKGIRALDRVAVVWKAIDTEKESGVSPQIITEPPIGEAVPESQAADWRTGEGGGTKQGKDLGLRLESPGPGSERPSRANSVKSSRSGLQQESKADDDDDSVAGVQVHIPESKSHIADVAHHVVKTTEVAKLDGTAGTKAARTEDLPGGVPENQLKTSTHSVVGSIAKDQSYSNR